MLERRSRPRSTGMFLTLCAAMLMLAMLTQQPWAAGLRGQAKSVLEPLASLMTAVSDRVDAMTAGFGDAAALRASNQRLEQENAELQREVAELQADGLDNAALRAALDFQRSYGHATVAAEVVERGPDGFSSSVLIDRGSAEGVRTGMVVVTGAGLVGRVVEVGPHAAMVETLADPRARVNAFLSRSGLEGTVSGGPGPLAMDVDPRFGTAPVAGEFAITSGVGGGYPRGLVVGRLASVDHQAAATVDHASVMWVNDIASLSVVLVVTDFVGT